MTTALSPVIVSRLEKTGLDALLRVRALHSGHRVYLPWHQELVFKGLGARSTP